MSVIRRWGRSQAKIAMAEELRTAAAATTTASGGPTPIETTSSDGRKKWTWPSLLRWIPSSTDHIIASEKRLLSLVKTPFLVEQVNIGSGPPGSKIRWFRSASDENRFINTVTFESKDNDSPTIVMVHGYGASQGFFFRNFDALARRFRVIAIDQLGWGGSSRPDFTCKSTEETEDWFIDSLEAWRKAKNLNSFILLGHSFGGYVAAKYANKHPEHVQHLILVGPAGFSADTDMSERLTQFKATWKGAVLNHLWESNFTPQKLVRGLGPWGPNLVRKYTSARFGSYATGELLNEEESKLLTDYIYHTLAAKGSGELCLKYIFSFGAFARKPLLHCASEWKVPTTFIYGYNDWMSYQGAQEARKHMKVPCEILRVPQGGHFVFIDNPSGFHSAVFHACRRFFSPNPDNEPLPEGLTSV
ncbi:putative 1-acylglycerol-3-phosphate O-acyltransferase [Bienertia sinuspersici]